MIALNVLYPKMRKYILPTFPNITQIVKKLANLLMIPNGERWHYIAVKNYVHYQKE